MVWMMSFDMEPNYFSVSDSTAAGYQTTVRDNDIRVFKF
jgi:hypothetical protein